MKTADEIAERIVFLADNGEGLHPIVEGTRLIKTFAEQVTKEHAIDWPDDKETERIRQLGKEKYYVGSSQSAYSEGFMDCVNWIKRVTTKQ